MVLAHARRLLSGGALAALALASVPSAEACTRVLSNDKGPVLVGRTMDWPESTEPVLTVLPRGLRHDGGLIGAARVVKDNPLVWTSKYGSLVTTVYGLGAADGVNERGLGAHMLYLNAADYRPARPVEAGSARRPVGAISARQRRECRRGAGAARPFSGRAGRSQRAQGQRPSRHRGFHRRFRDHRGDRRQNGDSSWPRIPDHDQRSGL